MPCLEITMPKTEPKTKERLAKELTDLFAELTGYEPEIFGIHFHEYTPDSVSLGGQIWDGVTGRPYLHFLLYSPRLKRSVKVKLVEKMSAAFVEIVRQQDWLPIIHLCEHPYDNVGVGGKLLSDRFEECARAEYYYKLPRD